MKPPLLNHRTITRKEIAAANDVSPETIRRNERALTLHRCRDRTCNRPVRYNRDDAARRLRARGFEVPEE